MYWTLELAHNLEDAPWTATRDELIDYAIIIQCFVGGLIIEKKLKMYIVVRQFQ